MQCIIIVESSILVIYTCPRHQVLLILGINGGGIVIGLTSRSIASDNSFAYAVGGSTIAVCALVVTYEAIMIVLTFTTRMNHSTRLLMVRLLFL